MALRAARGARRGRADRRRARAVAGALVLYTGAGLLALSPALRHAATDFLAYGTPRPDGVTPGDHLQTAYNLWLPGHQLARGALPLVDPYSFQPFADRVNFAGWPFGLVFWPLHALLGTVVGWNAFVVLTYVGAGGLAAVWLRSLGLPLGAALAGGLAFALAPYRSIQTAGGHLLGPVSLLLPLALWALETRRGWLAVAAIGSVPLSGQVHLALGAIPLFLAYALVRGRAAIGVVGAAVATGAALVVYAAAIRGTTGSGGRSFEQVERYSAEALDFVSRNARHGFESFVFLGWLLPVIAIAGLVVLWGRDRGLAAVLAAALALPVVFALGANTPLYRPVWSTLPGLHQTRVPERLLPIACLALAALAAFALARLPWRWATVAAIVLLALDLRVDPYRPLGSDEANDAYAAIDGDGRLLELPVFLPERQEGSVYLYYAMQSPRERPFGYSTTAPPEANEAALALRRLSCGDASPQELRLLRPLRVRYVALHLPLYRRWRCVPPAASLPGRVASADGVLVYELP